LNELANEILEVMQSKGFNSPATIHGADAEAQLAKLMLVTTEVAEAAEAVRDGDMENFGEELADVVIRVLHIAGACGIDMDAVIEKKMEKNRNRPFQHGRAVGC
jgi:NTP pyrophosphatase (non-canonical NTP hydrolase)